ncbi:MerR family transcriptional regulator [Actinomadura sp. 3N407]|uniref:MerR family transcriptional regulator n=1 Tax=Actinomadura sp. 3N407 TaxID=3457423 RepID=UPI003FCE6A0E
MRIGELERRTGVSQRLLRYYEEQNLIRPERRPSGYREYNEADVTTVGHVRTLLAAGLSTATIADVLPCLAGDGADLIADCPELLLDLLRERERIRTAIRELEAACGTLDTVIATAPPEIEREVDALLNENAGTTEQTFP